MRDQTSRRRFLTAAGSGVAAVLAGCGSGAPDDEGSSDTATDATDTDQDTATATEEPETQYTGGTLQMASPGPVQTLDPINAKGSGAGYNQYQESLMRFPNGDLPPTTELAESYESSNDGKTLTFKLKEGVQFHDGGELTASDFVYSWERLAQSENSRNKDDIIGGTFTIAHEGNTGEDLTNYEPGSLAVEAVSEYEFQFTMAEAFHGAIAQIAGGAFGVIPENSVGDIEREDVETEGEYEYNVFFSTKDDGPAFVSTGPFQVDSWSKGDQIQLTAFEDYHGEGPLIDGITYTVLGSSDAIFKRFQNKNLDILGPNSGSFPTAKFDPSKASIDRDRGSYRTGTYGPLDNGETVNYGEATALDTTYIVFNTDRTERPVRRAFAYLINQHKIADDFFKGVAEPAYAITPPPVFPAEDMDPADAYDAFVQDGENTEDVPQDFGVDGYPFGYDQAQIGEATRVMEEAGYSEDDPYEVTFTVFSGDSAWDSIAKRIQSKATAAHIDVSITKADFGTIISKAISGEMDMFSLGDGMEWPEADNFLRFLHAGNPGTAFTRWGFEDRDRWNDFMLAADNAWEDRYAPNKAPGEENQRERNVAYRIIEQMNWASVQELPVIHATTQRFWYPEVKVRMNGTMENQTFNTLQLERE